MSRDDRRTIGIAGISVLVALMVLGLKLVAWQITGSIALFSDALESLVNVATAIVALIAVTLAARPADATLPYGYHKAEYFSAVIVGVMIFIAAGLILMEAIEGVLEPRLPEAVSEGLILSGVATAVNLVWALVLIRQGRRRMSPALVADGRHLMTDVVSTLGVIVGLGLVQATGWAVLDSLLAGIVALTILWSGWSLIRESVGGLMDAAAPTDQQEIIREVIAAHAGAAIEAHDIRTRRAGRMTFIDFHLVVPGTMSVSAAHEICDRIEARLREAVAHAQVTIHVEPEHKAKHSGIVII